LLDGENVAGDVWTEDLMNGRKADGKEGQCQGVAMKDGRIGE